MTKLELKAEKRKLLGRKVKKLRAEGFLPANIYGKKIKSIALKTNLKEFVDIYKQAGETGVVYLAITGEKTAPPVLIGNVHKDPVDDQLLHAEFRKVDLTEKVQIAIPIEMIGEAPAVSKGGILVQLMDEIEVEALPTDLPEKIEVDVSGLEEIDQAIMAEELKVDKAKVKLMLEDLKQLVVKIDKPAEEEPEEEPTEEEGAGEAEGEEKEAPKGEKKEEESKDKQDKPTEEGKKPAKGEGNQDKPAEGKKQEKK